MEGLPSSEVARRFGYSAGAFRVLCHDFRRRALPEFFHGDPTGSTRAAQEPRAWPGRGPAQAQLLGL